MMRKILFIIIAVAALAAGCKNNSDTAVPRRYAYPRITACDTARQELSLPPFTFTTSSTVSVAEPNEGWMDLTYGIYGVKVHLSALTFADSAETARAIDNRYRRINLNFGDAGAIARQFINPAGVACMIAGTPDAGSSPISILAVRDNSVLSGAAVFQGNIRPIDSIAPIYRAVYNDLYTLLESLR